MLDKDSCQWYAKYDKNSCHYDNKISHKGGRSWDFRIGSKNCGIRVGASRQTISLIERGDYNPSITLALRISQVFGVPVEQVFYLTEEESK